MTARNAAIKETEQQAQMAVAAYLDALGVLWMHCPNEGKMSPQYGAKRKRLGVKAGVPDILIFSWPKRGKYKNDYRDFKGFAIELKVGKNKLTVQQSEWLYNLMGEGWITATCYGSGVAIKQLQEWGFK